ncbi:MAG: hypothetical protein HGB06_10300 [Chlorobaculum sp.]|nr:hypothetical protein [Chlorobaculum sp.]
MARGIQFTRFASANTASIAGIFEDYDRVMIADMPSRISWRIHPGNFPVEPPCTEFFGAEWIARDVYSVYLN